MYKLTNSANIVRIKDGAFVPTSPENADYVAYLDWLAAGNTPIPADVEDPKAAVRTEIDDLERASMLPYAVRQFMLMSMEADAVALGETRGLTKEQSLAILTTQNAGYRGVKKLHADIAAMRKQL